MASKQENVSDWMALAKAYDKAEREQGVEPYVIVSLRNRRNAPGRLRKRRTRRRREPTANT